MAAGLVAIAAAEAVAVVDVVTCQGDRSQSTEDAASAGRVRASVDVAYVADAGEVVGIEGVAVEHAETDADTVDAYRGAASEALEGAVTMPNSIPTASLAAADHVEKEPAPSWPPPSMVPPSSYPPFLLCSR